MRSWTTLLSLCPLDISEIISEAKEIDTNLNYSPDLNELEKYKMNLLKTKPQLILLINNLPLLLEDTGISMSPQNFIMLGVLSMNLARYNGVIDLEQEKSIEAYDGQQATGWGRVGNFRGILIEALYGLVYDSFYVASLKYNQTSSQFKVKDGEKEIEKTKDKNTFLTILFHILSRKLASLGGFERTKIGQQKRDPSILLQQSNIPKNWADYYTQEGRKKLAQEYKEQTGDDLTEELLKSDDLFGEEGGQDATMD